MKTTMTTASATVLAAGLALAGCGGGGDGSPTGTPTGNPGGAPTTPTTAATTPGVWKGTIRSTTTGSTVQVLGMTTHDGHSLWMTTDGRIWSGDMPLHGDHFEATFSGHMYEGDRFPDGTNHGVTTMNVSHHTTGTTAGAYAGCGDAGSFDMSLSPMWDRHASLTGVAGTYTRSTSNGYSMTMTIGANGQMTGSDTRGCVLNGTVHVPDPDHNIYGLDVTVTSCGSLDGHYQGTGTLLDADAMQAWMTAMHPLEHGGHTHGGTMGSGSHMMGHNTVPGGQNNLFMFSMANGQNGMMDALAR
jgi:hypothetical protein